MKKGISLITMIITIIVIIILAGVIILNLTNNNPIDAANEAVRKNDIETIKEQIQLYKLSETAKTNGNFDETSMNGKVSDFIPGMTKYDDEILIVNGKITFIGEDLDILDIIEELNGDQYLVEVGGIKHNKPNLSYLPAQTVKAVVWNNNNEESELSLLEARLDKTWYNYSAKKWANIYTNNNGNKAYWVWIPRYAYKINNPHTQTAEKIEIKFLNGTSNEAADGSSIDGYIVHPAFSFGGKELSGIWVAKYEASSSDPNRIETDGTYVGASTGGGNTTALQVRVLPNVYSWRNISTGNAQTVSMNIASSNGSVGTSANVDTHQMKNVEWGAVAYLSQSKYGEEPWNNPYGDTDDGSWKLKTGYAGTTKDSQPLKEGNQNLAQYNTTNGVKASTTGNIYGIYDMAGGSWERTAAFIENGNINITSHRKIEHIQNQKVLPQYAKYYDVYEPGDEEKEGATFYALGGENLWNSVAPYNVSQADNNLIRKRLSGATYEKFANKNGDALYETSNSFSYHGKFTSGTENYEWLIDQLRDSTLGAQFTQGWNGDYSLVGHAHLPWFNRGGLFYNGSGAGLFAFTGSSGNPYPVDSFRPVLVVGFSL